MIATVDDVRAPDADSKPIHFYLDVEFEIASSPVHVLPASYLWLHNPHHVAEYYSGSWSMAGPYMFVVQNVPTVVFWSGSMPADGLLLSAWFHGHRAGMSKYGMMLLAGSLTKIGLTCSDLGTYDVRNGVAGNFVSLSEIYQRLLNTQRVICRTDPDRPSWLSILNSSAQGIRDGKYDRRGEILCNKWNFSEGDSWSMVGFYSGEGGWKLYPQHNVFHMYADLKTVAPTDGPVWGEQFNACRASYSLNKFSVAGYLAIFPVIVWTWASVNARTLVWARTLL